MTPEGIGLGGLFLGSALLTGNLGNLLFGSVAGAVVATIHYQYYSAELRRCLGDVEERLGEGGLQDVDRKRLEEFKVKMKAQLTTLKIGSGCIGVATLVCPIAGAVYLLACVKIETKARREYRAYLDKVCV